MLKNELEHSGKLYWDIMWVICRGVARIFSNKMLYIGSKGPENFFAEATPAYYHITESLSVGVADKAKTKDKKLWL